MKKRTNAFLPALAGGILCFISVFNAQVYIDYTTSKLWLIKTDSLGDTLWTRSYGGEYENIGITGHELNGGGYVIAGRTDLSLKDKDFCKFWLLRTDSKGDTLWTRSFGNQFTDYDMIIIVDQRGNYLITAKRYDLKGSIDPICFFKIGVNGDSLWMKEYGEKKFVKLNDICELEDGSYLATGRIGGRMTERNEKLWLARFDDDGNLIWAKKYGWPFTAEGYQISKNGDGKYKITARRGKRLVNLTVDNNGKVISTESFGGIGLGFNSLCIRTKADNYFIFWRSNLVAKFVPFNGILWQKKFAECSVSAPIGQIVRG